MVWISFKLLMRGSADSVLMNAVINLRSPQRGNIKDCLSNFAQSNKIVFYCSSLAVKCSAQCQFFIPQGEAGHSIFSSVVLYHSSHLAYISVPIWVTVCAQNLLEYEQWITKSMVQRNNRLFNPPSVTVHYLRNR